jgi:uncharacterized protein YecE (DUF72 family)
VSAIHIGTSGWSYDDWKGPFYPAGLPSGKMLSRYVLSFSTVEINNSFYRLPDAGTLDRWRDAVPADFIFSAKASRYITHMKKLKDAGAALPPFFERMDRLGDRLGPILFQLPPRLGFDPAQLREFLERLDGERRCAFEFRDPSWFREETLSLLGRHGAAFCIYDLDGRQSPVRVTADFVYVRLHGPDGPYRGSYDERTLLGWAQAFSAWAREGRTVYCYFDNTFGGDAAANALRLKEMVEPG